MPKSPIQKKVPPKKAHLFKGESYDRQKRGEKYWFDDGVERKSSSKPLGVVGNFHGLTDAL